jgi:hypothetical protein
MPSTEWVHELVHNVLELQKHDEQNSNNVLELQKHDGQNANNVLELQKHDEQNANNVTFNPPSFLSSSFGHLRDVNGPWHGSIP